MSGTLYNRDSNITGVSVLGSPYKPDYGSSVSFFTKSNSYETDDGWFNYIPHSPNNLLARMSLNYTLRESEAQEMIVFFENLSGDNPFEFSDGTGIYKDQSGYLEEYQLRSITPDNYELTASVLVKDNAPLFSWSGKAFTNDSGVLYPNNTGLTSEKYQVVYQQNKINELSNFYYAKSGGFNLGNANGPSVNGGNWFEGDDFSMFQADNVQDIRVTPRVTKLDFKNSYYELNKRQNNIHKFERFVLRFNNRNDTETKAILHFLETKAGYRRFLYTCPQVFNQTKVFYSPSWRHTWVYKDVNNIEVELIEDPMGVVFNEVDDGAVVTCEAVAVTSEGEQVTV